MNNKNIQILSQNLSSTIKANDDKISKNIKTFKLNKKDKKVQNEILDLYNVYLQAREQAKKECAKKSKDFETLEKTRADFCEKSLRILAIF